MQTFTGACKPIEMTETLVTLYVFLSQTLDRCLDQAAHTDFPDQELRARLASTRAQVMDILTVNPVVKAKVGEECRRVLSLAAACLSDGPLNSEATASLRAERAMLKDKTMAITDLLAVLRAA
jgi:hypothetical protein